MDYQKLAEILQSLVQSRSGDAGRYAPPEFAMPVPQFSIQNSPQSPQLTLPRFSGSATVPAFGGNLGISGGYQPDKYQPEWSAMLNYRRQF